VFFINYKPYKYKNFSSYPSITDIKMFRTPCMNIHIHNSNDIFYYMSTMTTNQVYFLYKVAKTHKYRQKCKGYQRNSMVEEIRK